MNRHLKIPDRVAQWYLSSDLPLTASGKVQKFRVRELIEQGALPRIDAHDRLR
ncbi:cyclohexanecarboxylate-CoA ligase [Streptomyces spongiicola]|uniref:cyclohexanecarboxylate-CoA ligase n=1 Tax=Streptomyces spongiicola TaxID=1690221 RepID=UPI0013A54E5E|nr:cyclohexanecarboxylate-CoA ligase [Streptomyces spongiicola]